MEIIKSAPLLEFPNVEGGLEKIPLKPFQKK